MNDLDRIIAGQAIIMRGLAMLLLPNNEHSFALRVETAEKLDELASGFEKHAARNHKP